MKNQLIRFKEWTCIIRWKYYSNGRTALELVDYEDHQSIAVITVNLPNENLQSDEILIKDWSENEGMIGVLQKVNIIGPVIESVKTGFVTAKKCKLLIKQSNEKLSTVQA